MPDSIWLMLCVGFASLAFAVGRWTGRKGERADQRASDRFYESMRTLAAERLRRDIFEEGE